MQRSESVFLSNGELDALFGFISAGQPVRRSVRGDTEGNKLLTEQGLGVSKANLSQSAILSVCGLMLISLSTVRDGRPAQNGEIIGIVNRMHV